MTDTLFEAAVRYVDAHRSGPTKAIRKAASALQAVVDDVARQRVEAALADERRAHATELAHVDMSGREADAARIEDLERRLTDSDDSHGRTIEQRDLLEKWAEDLAYELGCEREWSNLHDHFACIRETALTLQSHYESSEETTPKLMAERDAYRAALADMVAGTPGARERAIETLRTGAAPTLSPGVVKAMAGGDSLGRFGINEPPEGQ